MWCSVCTLQRVEDEEAKQHSIENHSTPIAQLVEQLTLKHKVGSSNPSWCTLEYVFLVSFEIINVTLHSKHASRQD